MADVYVNGTDITAYVVEGSLKVQDKLNSRTTCTFRVVSDTFVADEGQVVAVYQDGSRQFEGTVDLDETEFYQEGLSLVTKVTAVSYDQLADRHLVAGVFGGNTLWWTCTDILNASGLNQDGVINGAQTGPIIDRVTFNYVTVAQAFNVLSELTGYVWFIDAGKTLNFFLPMDGSIALNTWDGDTQVEELKLKKSRANYRNVQYIRGGYEITLPQTETFKGWGTDGNNRKYSLRMPVGEVPTVAVNGAGKTVGINGVDQGKDWYWNKGSADIVQDMNATPLATTDTLSVTYKAMVPLLVVAEDGQEIKRRQAVEGGSGRYEAIESRADLFGHVTGDALANALLRRYGNITEEVTFVTDSLVLKAGYQARFNRPSMRAVGDYLITDVTLQDNQEGGLTSVVRAVKGEPVGGWIEFFKKLAAAGRKIQYNENEQLLLLRQLPEVVTVRDKLTVETGGAWVIGTGKLGFVQLG